MKKRRSEQTRRRGKGQSDGHEKSSGLAASVNQRLTDRCSEKTGINQKGSGRPRPDQRRMTNYFQTISTCVLNTKPVAHKLFWQKNRRPDYVPESDQYERERERHIDIERERQRET